MFIIKDIRLDVFFFVIINNNVAYTTKTAALKTTTLDSRTVSISDKLDSANIVSNNIRTFANGLYLIIGEIRYFAGSVLPEGWLLCDGSAISRTTYSELFSAIGTTWGGGDGSSTFNLPNLIDRFPQGSTVSGTYKAAGLPNITGSAEFQNSNNSGHLTGATEAFVADEGTKKPTTIAGLSDGAYKRFYFSASNCSSIYGNSTTVQPPAATLIPIIKY